MKKFNNVRKIFMALLTVAIITSLNVLNVKADNNYTYGIYELKNNVSHESELGMSMSRNYLDDTMTVKITNEEITFTIGFSGTAYMENYRIKINDVEVPVEIVEENEAEGTIKLQVVTDSLDNDLKACIYVGPMERDVEFGIIPDYETMTLIEEIQIEEPTEVIAEEEEAEAESVKETTDVELTTEKSNSNMGTVVIAFIVVIGVVAIFVAVKRKKK